MLTQLLFLTLPVVFNKVGRDFFFQMWWSQLFWYILLLCLKVLICPGHDIARSKLVVLLAFFFFNSLFFFHVKFCLKCVARTEGKEAAQTAPIVVMMYAL